MSDWREVNRANWDERVPLHLKAPSYDLTPLRAGQGALHAIEAAELGDVAGLNILHLQCHFGRDSLILAQQGTTVVGIDFSPPAIAAARDLARELGLEHRARFIEADVYAAPDALAEPASFDLVFVTWGTTGWLPDLPGWARVVAHFLRPGGRLYFADGHPAALVFEDATDDGVMPAFFAPYFGAGMLSLNDNRDYADPDARLQHSEQRAWMHGIAEMLAALRAAGLALDWLHEHPRLPWRMFRCLVADADGLYCWPDRQWLPLAYSLQASKVDQP